MVSCIGFPTSDDVGNFNKVWLERDLEELLDLPDPEIFKIGAVGQPALSSRARVRDGPVKTTTGPEPRDTGSRKAQEPDFNLLDVKRTICEFAGGRLTGRPVSG